MPNDVRVLRSYIMIFRAALQPTLIFPIFGRLCIVRIIQMCNSGSILTKAEVIETGS